MSKSTANKAAATAQHVAATVTAQPVARKTLFSVIAWSAQVEAAAVGMMSASKAMLLLIIEARENAVDGAKVREVARDSFAIAYATAAGCTAEEAASAKTVKNRVSDAMAIFKSTLKASELPANLQHAAAACRKAANAAAAPANDGAGNDDQGNGDDDMPPAPINATASALATISASLNVLRAAANADEEVLSIIAGLADTLAELGEHFEG